MTNPYNKVVLARISDLSGGNPELKTLVMSAVSGTSIVTGFFVDARGDQLGQSVTINITTATTLQSALTTQQKIDSGWNTGDAVGLIGRLSGSAMYIGTGGDASDGSIRSGMSTTTTYPEVPTSEYFTLGRVSSVVNTGAPPTTTTGGVGGGGGTEYTEGTTDGSITGVAILMESSGDALRPVQGSVTDGLLVNLGSNNDVTVTGTVTANIAAGTNNIGDVDVLTVPAPLNVTGGGTEASALRVTIANDSTGVLSIDDNGGSITVDGSISVANIVTASLAAGTNNIGDVDVLTVPAPLNVTGGGTEASALRVTIANDSTGVLSIDDNGGSITVDGSISVANTITANLAAGTNNIGDVDVLTVPAPLNVTGGGAEASALRVTIANDSTGVLSIDDNGSSLTVDGTVGISGTVAVTQSGTWDEVGINDSGNSITVDAPVGTPVNVQIGDGTRTATVRDTGSSDSLNIAIVNESGSQITSFSAQYTFGDEQSGSVGTSTAVPLFDGLSGRPSRAAGTLKIRLCNCSDTYNLLVRYDADPTTTAFLECLLPLETRDIDCSSVNEARILAYAGTISYVAQVLS